MDCRPPGSSVHGILQTRILEWVATTPGDLPNPRIEPQSLTLQADSLPSEPQGEPHLKLIISWGFPGGPVVKTLTSNTGGVCLIPGQAAKIPHVL